MNKSIKNTGILLVNENLKAMKDGALIAAGKGVFKVADKNVPKELTFLTSNPFGKVFMVGLMAMGVSIYDQPHLGAVVNAMAADAFDGVLGVLGDAAKDAYNVCGKLHDANILPTDGRVVELRKSLDGANGKDARFSFSKEPDGKSVELPPAATAPDYWPVKQSDLRETVVDGKKTGKYDCPTCNRTNIKRRDFGMAKFPQTHPGKPDVLCCEHCRATASKEVKAVVAEQKKQQLLEEAVAAAKAKEERFNALKIEITEAQEKLTKAENSAKNFEKMLEAQPDDEAMIAGVDAANAKVIEMSDKLTALEAEAEKLEQELATPKADANKGKEGVVGALLNGGKK